MIFEHSLDELVEEIGGEKGSSPVACPKDRVGVIEMVEVSVTPMKISAGVCALKITKFTMHTSWTQYLLQLLAWDSLQYMDQCHKSHVENGCQDTRQHPTHT